jgi:hypothetical protein
VTKPNRFLDTYEGSPVESYDKEAQINYLMRSEHVRNWWQMNATRTFSNVFVAEVNRITDT